MATFQLPVTASWLMRLARRDSQEGAGGPGQVDPQLRGGPGDPLLVRRQLVGGPVDDVDGPLRHVVEGGAGPGQGGGDVAVAPLDLGGEVSLAARVPVGVPGDLARDEHQLRSGGDRHVVVGAGLRQSFGVHQGYGHACSSSLASGPGASRASAGKLHFVRIFCPGVVAVASAAWCDGASRGPS